jgi:hypothetical protein
MSDLEQRGKVPELRYERAVRNTYFVQLIRWPTKYLGRSNGYLPYSPRLLTPHLMALKSPMNNHPLYQVHSPDSTTPLVRRPMVLVREEPLFAMFTRAIL